MNRHKKNARLAIFLVAIWASAASARAQAGASPRPSADVTTATAAAPTPTPAETPSPEELRYYPPLSLDDALELVWRGQALLGEPKDKFWFQRRDTAQGMLVSAREYCEFLDNRHSSLGSYTWYKMAEQDAPARGVSTDEARLPSIFPDVSAISFEAEEGDVWVVSVKVVESRKHTVTLPVKSTISQDLPWTVICYLPERMTIRRLFTTRQTWGREAKLVLYAGVTREPEYGRRAISLMQLAEKNLDEGRVAEARMDLRRAHELMKDFREDLIDKHSPAQGKLLGRTRGSWPEGFFSP